ncbi:unnamed protein product [Scytosiphon promiscuus]
MCSAEVFCWGSLSPIPGEEHPVPVEDGRSGLVRHVYAGSSSALLARAIGAKWVPDQRCPSGNGGDNSWDLPGIECAAFGQKHRLLLRSVIADCGHDSHVSGGGETKTEVLAWGSGEQGQLGLGAGTWETRLPKTIAMLSSYRVVQVACGSLHSAAITSYGDLFTWGRGTEGQLGHASRHLAPELNDAITGIQLRPKPVPAFLATKKRQRPVAGVSCGANFTLVVTRIGEVWAFGGGAMGQLGIGRLTRAGVPTVVMPSCPSTGEPFAEVAAGWAHSLARTSGGRVFSWGFNALGSLGLGDHRTRFLPEDVPLSGRRHPNDQGGNNTAVGGELPSSSSQLMTTNHLAVVKIHASGNNSGALTAGGELFTWGSGTSGGLGHGGGNRCQSRPEKVEHVLRPRRVERLAGAEVTDFALSTTGGVALVPLRVKSIDPTSGPMEAGCKVFVKGYGFWDSPDIVVKFTPVSKGHKLSASRSAVGTYVQHEAGQDRKDLGGGLELLACTAPRFASPEAAYVEVSMDGTSFTTDCVAFRYYRTPEVTQITPDICRPPFPRLRLDGEHFSPNERFSVRFEEEREDGAEASAEGYHERVDLGESSSPFESSSEGNAASPSRLLPQRVFTVSGRVESEVVEVGKHPDTELPVHEERWFLACDSPALPPEARLPFVARVTVAPNGADFNGEHVRFIAHDPHADICRPLAVPVPDAPPLAPAASDGSGSGCDEHSERGEVEGPRIHITGRNLYRGPSLAARLRFGLGDESVVPLRSVTYDTLSDSIVGVIPTDAGALVAGAAGEARAEPQHPPAIGVAVEASVDGHEYFAVPGRLTLYRSPCLTLQGDGLFPEEVGGWAELKTAASTFRGNDPKVRMVSEAHGIDVTLALHACPLLEEVEGGAKEASEAPPVEESKAVPPPKEKSPSASEDTKKLPPPQEPPKEAVAREKDQEPCDFAHIDTSDPLGVWEEGEVPASEESFFFAVPPLSKPVHGDPVSCSGDSQPLSEETLPALIASGDGGGTRDEGAASAGASGPEESKTVLNLLVTLNGIDWQTVLGPPLTYFQPPPEPVPEPEEEPKKGKGKKR